MNDELLKRITVNPEIFGGKPIIREMRISVELILSLLAQGETEDAILVDYPDLTREDLRASSPTHTPSLPRIRWTRFRCSEILR